MPDETNIRDANQMIIGILEEMEDGTQLLLSFPGRQILGRFWPKDNTTPDFPSASSGEGISWLPSYLNKEVRLVEKQMKSSDKTAPFLIQADTLSGGVNIFLSKDERRKISSGLLSREEIIAAYLVKRLF